ncbi:MAG: hypothetical protein MI785_27115 [Kiloniellales bacterium]|nr:hypothetical protein [Kiloniellales bacterium]
MTRRRSCFSTAVVGLPVTAALLPFDDTVMVWPDPGLAALAGVAERRDPAGRRPSGRLRIRIIHDEARRAVCLQRARVIRL